MPFFHFTARAKLGFQPFSKRDLCADAWARLRAQFEGVLACVLMPDHLHLIIECGDARDAEAARMRLVIALRSFTKCQFPGKKLWEHAPPPRLIPDVFHLRRQIRYVHLNPCRRGLASDPVEWEWSTHRDAVGAAFPVWLDLPRLEKIWGSKSIFQKTFHHYVSADSTVRVEGTPVPVATDPRRLVSNLDRVADAVLQATRAKDRAFAQSGSHSRKVCAQIAHRLGGRNANILGEWLGVTSRTLYNLISPVPAPAEEKTAKAALLILSQWQRFVPNPHKSGN